MAQSQQATLVQAAQREAKLSVQSFFQIPLRIVGKSEIKVVATFGPSG